METWQTVADELERTLAGPTASQLARASQLGLTEVTSSTPQLLAIHHLRREMGADAGFVEIPIRGSVAGRIEYLRLVMTDAGLKFVVPSSEDHLMALLHVAWGHLNVRRLREARPEPGDIVARRDGWYEISTIGSGGLIYFKGVGQRDYAMNLGQVIKSTDSKYEDYRKKAANIRAAARPVSDQLGALDRKRLEPWLVDASPAGEARERLVQELEAAADERPIQRLLETYPELLTRVLLSHQGRWVIPQVQLGSEFRPDFLVGGLSSLGIEWFAVELESPTANLSIKSGELGRLVRHGVHQIEQWREWLQENLDYARKGPNGLNLPGIRPDLQGLVLVGRSHDNVDGVPPRVLEGNSKRIAVRTYDWLLRTLDDSNVGRGRPLVPEWYPEQEDINDFESLLRTL